jgi:hypothetical protein
VGRRVAVVGDGGVAGGESEGCWADGRCAGKGPTDRYNDNGINNCSSCRAQKAGLKCGLHPRDWNGEAEPASKQ